MRSRMFAKGTESSRAPVSYPNEISFVSNASSGTGIVLEACTVFGAPNVAMPATANATRALTIFRDFMMTPELPHSWGTSPTIITITLPMWAFPSDMRPLGFTTSC